MQPEERASSRISRPRRAVIIDDDDSILRLTSRALEDLGLECVTFWDAESALSWLSEHAAPQLIVVDVMLPQMSGLAFVRELRIRRRFADVPILLFTARTELSDPLHATKLSARFLKKPFRLHELRGCVQELLGDVSQMKRVLIVDDDDGVRDALTNVVQDEGYQALCARDAFEALSMLRRNARPDVVLLDIMMPGLDGISFANELRHELSTPPPVVLVSALDAVASDARRIGAFAHLRKPLVWDDVANVIRRAATA